MRRVLDVATLIFTSQQRKSGFWRLILAAMTAAAGSLANAEAECVEPIGPEAALDAGVAAIYSAVAETNYSDVEGTPLEAVRYQGLAHFLAQNPNCCTFIPYGQDEFAPTPEWVEQYSFYGFVRATYKAYRIQDGDMKREVDSNSLVAITACGQVIWYDVDDDNW